MYKNAIFDVDGTIFDSFKGVRECLVYTFNKMGKPIPKEEVLRSFLGPALYDSLSNTLKFTEDETKRAIDIYRSVYETIGVNGCEFFEGYPQIFERLKKAGVIISVASAKPKHFVLELFEKFKIKDYFEKVECPTDESITSDKTQLILNAVCNKSAIMIGDRKYDILAARNAGVDCIGVSYGFCYPTEFDDYPPDFVARNTDDIFEYITK